MFLFFPPYDDIPFAQKLAKTNYRKNSLVTITLTRTNRRKRFASHKILTRDKIAAKNSLVTIIPPRTNYYKNSLVAKFPPGHIAEKNR